MAGLHHPLEAVFSTQNTMRDANLGLGRRMRPPLETALLEPCRAWRNGACCRQGTMKLHVFTDFRSKRIRLYWSHAFLVHDYKPHDFVGSSRIGVKLMTKL